MQTEVTVEIDEQDDITVYDAVDETDEIDEMEVIEEMYEQYINEHSLIDQLQQMHEDEVLDEYDDEIVQIDVDQDELIEQRVILGLQNIFDNKKGAS